MRTGGGGSTWNEALRSLGRQDRDPHAGRTSMLTPIQHRRMTYLDLGWRATLGRCVTRDGDAHAERTLRHRLDAGVGARQLPPVGTGNSHDGAKAARFPRGVGSDILTLVRTLSAHVWPGPSIVAHAGMNRPALIIRRVFGLDAPDLARVVVPFHVEQRTSRDLVNAATPTRRTVRPHMELEQVEDGNAGTRRAPSRHRMVSHVGSAARGCAVADADIAGACDARASPTRSDGRDAHTRCGPPHRATRPERVGSAPVPREAARESRYRQVP